MLRSELSKEELDEIARKREVAQKRWARRALKRELEENQRRLRRHLTKKNSKKKRARYPYYDTNLVLEKEPTKAQQLFANKMSAIKMFTEWVDRKGGLFEQDPKKFLEWLRIQKSCETFEELYFETQYETYDW